MQSPKTPTPGDPLMGLRDRIASERARSDQAAVDGTELYRRRLLEIVDFNELAQLTDSQRRMRLSGSSVRWSAATAR